jgi:cbb3-type cytochrome oxidase maturation protein
VSVIYVLLPVAILFAAGALWVFIRAVRRGQFDDLDTPAVRMLHDDDDGEVGRSADEPPDERNSDEGEDRGRP